MAIGDNGTVTTEALPGRRAASKVVDPTKTAFFWLSCFFVIYCARPEDYIPGLKYIPMAKITAILAAWALFNAAGRTPRHMKDLPKEARLLLIMILTLFFGGFLSPVWKGGAVNKSLDFAKIYIAWVLIYLIITSFDRLRKIMFIQAYSVVLIGAVALVKGRNVPRLNGVMGGIYGNSNDLAFAIVLVIPLALAFMLTTKNPVMKVFWFVGMLVMLLTIFATASRAGFIDLVISGSVTLYYFAIKGKRLWLLVATVFLGGLILLLAGGKLYDRFQALSGHTDDPTEQSALGSYQARMFLMKRAVEGITEYPLFGVGVGNFVTYSTIWHEVHMTYLQIAVEGGIPVFILYLMFFWRGFKNLKILRKAKNLDEDIVLFVGAMYSTMIGFVVGAVFAPEAYQLFPYFAVAFVATLLATVRETEQASASGPAIPPPKRGRHFLEVYADRGTTGAASPVR